MEEKFEEINNEFKPRQYEVQSNTDKDTFYTVSNFRPKIFTCDCRGFKYNGHTKEGYRNDYLCPHIKEVKEKLENGDKAELKTI